MLVCNTYNKIYDKLILLIFKLLKAQTNKEDQDIKDKRKPTIIKTYLFILFLKKIKKEDLYIYQYISMIVRRDYKRQEDHNPSHKVSVELETLDHNRQLYHIFQSCVVRAANT